MANEAALDLIEVSMRHDPGRFEQLALKDFSLAIPAGSQLVVLGPSGCGKSTLLRCIAGVSIYEGEILIGGRDRRKTSPSDLKCDWLPQRANETFITHRTLADNIALGIALRGDAPPNLRDITAAAELLGVAHLLGRRPREVSGGELQRAALCRTILSDAPLVLLDEPLTGIDEQHRHGLRLLLGERYRSRGATVVWVSHDVADAFALADRCAIISDGRLQQSGRPIDIVNDPANVFVLRFFGAPEVNELNPNVLSAVFGLCVSDSNHVLVRACDVHVAPVGMAPPGKHIILGNGSVVSQRWISDRVRVLCHIDGYPGVLLGEATTELSGTVMASVALGKLLMFDDLGRRVR